MSGTPIKLSLQDSFELEKFKRVLKTESDIEKLRTMALTLLQHVFVQKATLTWMAMELLTHTGKEFNPGFKDKLL